MPEREGLKLVAVYFRERAVHCFCFFASHPSLPPSLLSAKHCLINLLICLVHHVQLQNYLSRQTRIIFSCFQVNIQICFSKESSRSQCLTKRLLLFSFIWENKLWCMKSSLSGVHPGKCVTDQKGSLLPHTLRLHLNCSTKHVTLDGLTTRWQHLAHLKLTLG